MDAVAEVKAPSSLIRFVNTVRLVPSRYPSIGILDQVAGPEDLGAIIELETWTNDRISTELGTLHRLPESEWVVGKPMSSVVMAAFCHPRPDGGRFNGSDRGAWYAARSISTAHAEVIYHRTKELEEIGVSDIRESRSEFQPLYHPASYAASQAFARRLLDSGSNGVVYRSVRDPRGECIACFRPKLVKRVTTGPHFEYRWNGSRNPAVRQLA
jgi:hypothetical protein